MEVRVGRGAVAVALGEIWFALAVGADVAAVDGDVGSAIRDLDERNDAVGIAERAEITLTKSAVLVRGGSCTRMHANARSRRRTHIT